MTFVNELYTLKVCTYTNFSTRVWTVYHLNFKAQCIHIIHMNAFMLKNDCVSCLIETDFHINLILLKHQRIWKLLL